MKSIKLACGVLDAREALAYLIGDAAGFGLITAESARKAGDKAAKLVWVKKGTASIKADLAEAERAVQRRAGKLPAGVSIEKELADARADVLRTAVELPVVKRPVERSRPRPPPLPPPPPPLPPPPPPPPPAELDPCLIRWCKNQARGLGPKDVVAHMSERIHRRKKRERAWRPTCPRDAAEKAALLARREEADARWCTCADGTPPWLCPCVVSISATPLPRALCATSARAHILAMIVIACHGSVRICSAQTSPHRSTLTGTSSMSPLCRA